MREFIERFMKLFYILFYSLMIIQIIYMIYEIQTSLYTYTLRHYFGIILFALFGIILVCNFKLFRVLITLLLIIGLFGGIAITPEIDVVKFTFNLGSLPIPIFYGQPIFVPFLIMHLFLSYKIFWGVGTKEYWQKLIQQRI